MPLALFDQIDDTDDRKEARIAPVEHIPSALDKIERVAEDSRKRSAYSQAFAAQNKEARERRDGWKREMRHTQDGIDRHGEPSTPQGKLRTSKLQQRIEASLVESKKREEAIKTLPGTLPIHIVYEELAELSGKRLKDARVSVKLPKQAKIVDEVAASRNTIARLISKRGSVRNALLPRDIAEAKLVVNAERDAEKNRIDYTPNAKLVRPFSHMKPRQGATKYPTLSLETGMQLLTVEDGAGIIKCLFKDQIIAQGKAALAKLYEGNPLVVPESEREARMAEIDEQILAECRREEALIELAEAQGLEVLRRPNAPILAVLGIAIDDSPIDSADDDFG